MERVTIEDALDYCLANPDGLSAEELLGRFPEHREELAPLLALGSQFEALTPPVPAERRAAMKQRLLQRSELRAPSSEQVRVSAPPRARARLRPAWVAVAVVALLVALVWPASAGSLPDSPFYQVKLTTENVLLSFERSPAGLVRGHMGLADVRLFDLRTMHSRNRLGEAGAALDNFHHHVKSGVSAWLQTAGDERAELAKLLYTSAVAADRTFKGFGSAAATLPPPIQTTIDQAVQTVSDLNKDAEQALRESNLDPNTLPTPNVPEIFEPAPGQTPEGTSTAEITPAQATRPPAATPAQPSPTEAAAPEPTSTPLEPGPEGTRTALAPAAGTATTTATGTATASPTATATRAPTAAVRPGRATPTATASPSDR